MLEANECGVMYVGRMGSIKSEELHNIAVIQAMPATASDYRIYIKKSNSLKI
nr:MAG TPA: hypothetical protein [Caudoviricetes sp.]